MRGEARDLKEEAGILGTGEGSRLRVVNVDPPARELVVASRFRQACVEALEKARNLQKIREPIGELVFDEGKVESAPPLDENGHAYVPSKAAFERWAANAR